MEENIQHQSSVVQIAKPISKVNMTLRNTKQQFTKPQATEPMEEEVKIRNLNMIVPGAMHSLPQKGTLKSTLNQFISIEVNMTAINATETSTLEAPYIIIFNLFTPNTRAT